MDREGTITLLRVILAGTPRLPGAACVGQYQLFDEIPGRPTPQQRRERVEAAVTVCRGCPVRASCPSRRD